MQLIYLNYTFFLRTTFALLIDSIHLQSRDAHCLEKVIQYFLMASMRNNIFDSDLYSRRLK